VTIAPLIEERPAVHYIAVRDRLHRDHLDTTVPRALEEVRAGLQELLVTPGGPPLVRYFVVDYQTGDVEVHVGFPVDTAKAPSGRDRLRVGDLPAGRYAVVMHAGPYETLVDTTRALLAWAEHEGVNWAKTEDNQVTRWVGRVEHYLVAPPAETDPAKWRTEVAILLR